MSSRCCTTRIGERIFWWTAQWRGRATSSASTSSYHRPTGAQANPEA